MAAAAPAVMDQAPLAPDEVRDQGNDAPKDPDENLGEWNERLDKDLISCIKTLVQEYCDEFRYPRRLEVMAAWRSRMFYREVQHIAWNWESETWEALGPLGTKEGTEAEKTDSAVLYSTNIYQGFADSYIAIMTQNVPGIRWEPEDPDDEADIAIADAAEPMRKIIQHENDPVKLLTRAAYLSWTDGRIHGWTRADKDKRTRKMRECQSIEGAMEVKVPILADNQDEFLYLQFSKEYRVETVRAKVKERDFEEKDYWKKITGGQTGNGQDIYERTARISAKQGISMRSAGGDAYAQLVTTQRTWLRPEAFNSDKVSQEYRERLEKIFPNGCNVEFDNGVYTGSRNANMDDEWTVENIMEGDGQFRNGKGTCLLSVQERSNDIINAAQDIYEKTLPASHWDQKMYDVDGMRRQPSTPGARYPVSLENLQVGDTLSAHVFFEPAATVSADMLQYLKELMVEIPQFLTGISAILFGQDQMGDKSGKALSIQQNMAMGRIGLPWNVLKRFYTNMMLQAVRLAKRLRGDTGAKLSTRDEQGNRTTLEVDGADLSGGELLAYPDNDQGFPESWTAKRATYMGLLQEGNTDPIMRQTLTLPRNQELGKKLIGLTELQIPGADSWQKQMEEIGRLLQESPVKQTLPQAVPDQQTGTMQMAQQEILVPSIPIDATWDDNQAEFLTIKEWINGPEGRKAKKENKPGFDNVKLHGELHKMAMEQQAAAAAPQAPVVPPGALAAVAKAAAGAKHHAAHPPAAAPAGPGLGAGGTQ